MVSKKRLERRGKNTNIKFIVMIVGIIVISVTALFVWPLVQPKTIEINDCATLTYIGSFASNETVFTTSYIDPVQRIGAAQTIVVSTDQTRNAPSVCGVTYKIKLWPEDAVHALIGMHEGEHKNITLSPAEAYGDWDANLANQYGLSPYPVDEIWTTLINNISLEEFLYYFSNVAPAKGVVFDYWSFAVGINETIHAEITNVTDETVTFKLLPINGTTFTIPILKWTATILVTNSTMFTIHSDIPQNYTFSFQDTKTKETVWGKVLALNDTFATVGVNTAAPSIEFVGQSLTFEFNVEKITKKPR